MISGSTHQDVYQNVETLNCWPQVDTIGSSPITRLYSSHTFEVPPDCVSWRSSPKKQQFINSSLFTNLKINQNPSKSLYSPDIPRVSLMDILHGFVFSQWINPTRIPDSAGSPQDPGPKALAPLRAYPDGHGRIPSVEGVFGCFIC